METKIIKRTFAALKYPKNSPERIKLNENSETSEYMSSFKYLAVINLPETKTHYAVRRSKTTKTKAQAEEWLKDNAVNY